MGAKLWQKGDHIVPGNIEQEGFVQDPDNVRPLVHKGYQLTRGQEGASWIAGIGQKYGSASGKSHQGVYR